MLRKAIGMKAGMLSIILSLLMSFSPVGLTSAQQETPTLRDPKLGVRSAITGLVTPISMAFLGSNEFLVLEKNTGKVQHVLNGKVQNTALDLAVNNSSERGLLGIA